MWDENKVLELLKDMPQVLTDENLCDIQKVIDDNKYWNGKSKKSELCGIYAPFCKICDKNVLTPCAVAYVRMKIAEGAALKMENVSSNIPHREMSHTFEKRFVGVAQEDENNSQDQSDNVKDKKLRIGVGYRKYGL